MLFLHELRHISLFEAETLDKVRSGLLNLLGGHTQVYKSLPHRKATFPRIGSHDWVRVQIAALFAQIPCVIEP